MPPEEQAIRNSRGQFIPGQRASPSTEIKKGQKLSEETCAKMRGRTPWNKGLKGFMAGEKNPNFGKHPSEETIEKIRLAKQGQIPTERQLECLKLARVPGHNKGKIPLRAFPGGEAHPFYVGKRGQKNMSGQEWFDYKNTIIARDNHTCQKCGATKRLQVHHIVPLRHGGNDEPSNLITVCPKCHKSLDFPLIIADHSAREAIINV